MITNKYIFSIGLMCLTLSSIYSQINFISSTPSPEDYDVDKKSIISLVFDSNIDLSTINSNSIVITGSTSGKIDGTFNREATNTVTFHPNQDFNAGDKIDVNLTKNILNNEGSALEGYHFSFKIRTSTNSYFNNNTPDLKSVSSPIVNEVIVDIKAFDIDSDGDQDVLYTGYNSHEIVLAINDGQQNYTIQTIATPIFPRAIDIADIDGDNNYDIVAALREGEAIIWYKNMGNYLFSTQPNIDDSTQFEDVKSLDFDGDGDVDIIATSSQLNAVYWFENDGNQIFTKHTINNEPKSSSTLNISDIDQDGDLDLLVSAFFSDDLVWYENDGNQSFTEHTMPVFSFLTSNYLIDLDNDGDIDFLATDFIAGIIWYENDGNQNFTQKYIANGSLPFKVKAGDLDGDGDQDILLANAGNSNEDFIWYENDGHNSFTKHTLIGLSGESYNLLPLDLDGDEDLDMIGSTQSHGVVWFENEDNKWLGTTSTDWDTDSNWSKGSIPSINEKVVIQKVSNMPIAQGNISANGIDIHSDSSLTVGGNITNNGMIEMESGSSLIAQNTTATQLTYRRYLSTNNWYLLHPPVTGENYLNLYNSNSLARGSNNHVGIASYNNNDDSWNYFSEPVSSEIFNDGQGIAVKLTQPNNFTFTGTLNTENTSHSISSSGSSFNLIGNPYPSYLPANLGANENENILSSNMGALREMTLWFWDQEAKQYITVNQVTDPKFIAPGQGFFVSSNSGSGHAISFTESMQSHQQNDTFRSTQQTKTSIQIKLSTHDAERHTDIFYIEQGTLGFDNGYDSSLFSTSENTISIYTKQISGQDNQTLAIQSLPMDSYSSIIPIGIYAEAGENLSFSALSQNLPEGIRIFLEDTETDSYTELSEADMFFNITLTNSIDGFGRFYLHTTTSSLNSSDSSLIENIQMYPIGNKTLQIKGLPIDKKTEIVIYNLIGIQVFQKVFQNTESAQFKLPQLAQQVYLAQIRNKTGINRKKFILK